MTGSEWINQNGRTHALALGSVTFANNLQLDYAVRYFGRPDGNYVVHDTDLPHDLFNAGSVFINIEIKLPNRRKLPFHLHPGSIHRTVIFEGVHGEDMNGVVVPIQEWTGSTWGQAISHVLLQNMTELTAVKVIERMMYPSKKHHAL